MVISLSIPRGKNGYLGYFRSPPACGRSRLKDFGSEGGMGKMVFTLRELMEARMRAAATAHVSTTPPQTVPASSNDDPSDPSEAANEFVAALGHAWGVGFVFSLAISPIGIAFAVFVPRLFGAH